MTIADGILAGLLLIGICVCLVVDNWVERRTRERELKSKIVVLQNEMHRLKAENTAHQQRVTQLEHQCGELGEVARRRVEKLVAIREILNGSGEGDSCTS